MKKNQKEKKTRIYDGWEYDESLDELKKEGFPINWRRDELQKVFSDHNKTNEYLKKLLALFPCPHQTDKT